MGGRLFWRSTGPREIWLSGPTQASSRNQRIRDRLLMQLFGCMTTARRRIPWGDVAASLWSRTSTDIDSRCDTSMNCGRSRETESTASLIHGQGLGNGGNGFHGPIRRVPAGRGRRPTDGVRKGREQSRRSRDPQRSRLVILLTRIHRASGRRQRGLSRRRTRLGPSSARQ